MAQTLKITQKDVDAICARLRGQGKMPSVRLIRAEHGAGSTGTIQQMLRVWEAENPEVESAVTITATLQKALAENMGYEITRAKQEMGAKLEVATETINDLVNENEQLTEQAEQLQNAHDQLMDGLATYKGQVQQLETDVAAARAAEQQSRDDADKLRIELAKAQLRIEQADKLQADHATLQIQLEQERTRREAADNLAGINGAQRDSLAERLTEEKARSEQLAAQVDKLAKELTNAAVRVEASHARLESAEIQLTAAKETAAKAKAKAATALAAEAEWKGHATELRDQVQQLQAQRPAGGAKEPAKKSS